MHIQDGFLGVKSVIGWYGVSLIFITKGVSDVVRHSKKMLMYKPLLGLVGAAVFFLSLLPIPVPITGTSSHPAGTPIAAVLVGPFAGTVLSVVALLFQALFFAHGGLSTLGANVFSMGVVGSLVGYSMFRLSRKLRLSLVWAGFLAGFAGDLGVYISTSFQLALAVPAVKGLTVLEMFGTFLKLFVPTQLPLAFLEGLVTAGMLSYIAKVRPDILTNLGVLKGSADRGDNGDK